MFISRLNYVKHAFFEFGEFIVAIEKLFFISKAPSVKIICFKVSIVKIIHSVHASNLREYTPVDELPIGGYIC